MRGQILAIRLPHVGFVVAPVAQEQAGLTLAFENQDVGADAVEEPAVEMMG